jgi:hypothetical protein
MTRLRPKPHEEYAPQLPPPGTVFAFAEWWHSVGSGILPRPGDDMEIHAKRVAQIAWMQSTHESKQTKRPNRKRDQK